MHASVAGLGSLFEYAPDPILIADAEAHFVAANPAAVALLGYQRDELLGRSIEDVIVPGPVAGASEYARFIRGGPWQGEVQVRTKSGTLVPTEAHTIMLAGPEGMRSVSFLRDLTRRKQLERELSASEAKFRTLVEQQPVVVYQLANDERERPLYFSPYIEELTGEAPEEALAFTGHWLDLVHPEDRERVAAENSRTELTGETFRVEYRHRRKDGTYVWILDECVPVRDNAGQIIGWQGVMVDISERKRIDEELQAALEAARAANRATSKFLSIMSYQVHTPLQTIIGYAEILLSGPEGSLTLEQATDIGYIHQAAKRLVALVKQMFDFSRLEAGQMALTPELVALDRIIADVRQDLAPQVMAKDLALYVDVPPDLPAVLADPIGLHQSLLNLVDNAVKFTTAGEIRVTARAVGDRVTIAVSDTGMGIPADALPHIFEEFRQPTSSMTRRFDGAGLGLAIAKKLVEQQGGEISVTSRVGVGSTFTVQLPAAVPPKKQSSEATFVPCATPARRSP